MQRSLSARAVVAVVVLQAPVAAGAGALPDHRWTLQGNFVINTPSDPLPGDAALAISLKRRLGERLAFEAALGPGLPVTTVAKRPGGGTQKVDLGSGLHAAALLRAEHRLTPEGRAILSLGAGPSLVSGDVFGTVPMARIDAGVDWRFAEASIFSLTVGYESVLSTSRKPFAEADCVQSSDCPPYYKAGKGQVVARWGLGLTF